MAQSAMTRVYRMEEQAKVRAEPAYSAEREMEWRESSEHHSRCFLFAVGFMFD